MVMGRPRKAKTNLPRPSEAKSKVAAEKVRVNGRFVSTDPKTAEKKKEELATILNNADMLKSDAITEEDRELIGDDSLEFFKLAMMRAKTYYDGAKYAKELLAKQYPSLQAVEMKQEIEITQAKVMWIYDAPTKVIESVIEDATRAAIESGFGEDQFCTTAACPNSESEAILPELQTREDTGRDT